MTDAPGGDARLPPDEFKAEYQRRGWTGITLAQRWGKSAEYVSRIGKDPSRDMVWDDAVRGLPTVPNQRKPRTKKEK
jgi:hypothetical protein